MAEGEEVYENCEAQEDIHSFRGAIQSNKDLIANNTILEGLLPKLVEERVLSYEDRQLVTSCQTTNHSVSTLLSIMMQKDLHQLQRFRTALTETGQGHIAGLLGEETLEAIMSDEHKDRLQDNHAKLYERLEVRCLLQYLRRYNAFSSIEAQHLEGKPTELEMRISLLEMLPRKPDSAFQILIEALVETNQRHLACLLDDNVELPGASFLRTSISSERSRPYSDGFLRQSKVYQTMYLDLLPDTDCASFYEPLNIVKDSNTLERSANVVRDHLEKGTPVGRLNLLLLGHSGAGKSSLINSLLMAVNPRGYQELAIRGTSGSRTESLYHTAFLREYHMFANLHEFDKEVSYRCQPKILDINGDIESKQVLQHEKMVPILRNIIQGKLKAGTNIIDLLKQSKIPAGKVNPLMMIDRIVVVHDCNEEINEDLMAVIKKAASDPHSEVPVSVVLTKVDMIKGDRVELIMKKKQKIQTCLNISDDDVFVTSLYCYKMSPGIKRRPDIDQDMCNLWLKWLHNGNVPVEEPLEPIFEARTVTKKIADSHFPSVLNIGVFGPPGAGKSSLINSLVMALNPSGYLDICPRGHPGDPAETDRKSKTMNPKIINVLNYIQKDKSVKGQLNLVEYPGLPDDSSLVTKTIHKLMLNGQINEDIQMDSLLALKPEEINKKYGKLKPHRRVDIVVAVYSAIQQLPTSQFESMKHPIRELSKNGQELPLFAVMTNTEDLSTAEKQTKTEEFAKAIGLEGQEEKVFPTSLYCNKVSPNMTRNHGIDRNMCDVWNKILSPEFIKQNRQKIQIPKHSVLKKYISSPLP